MGIIPTKIVAGFAGDMAKKSLNALVKKVAEEYLTGKANGNETKKVGLDNGETTDFIVNKVENVMGRFFKNVPVEEVNSDELAKRVADDLVNDKVREEIDGALYRLSTIATSLEKSDEHQMVADIMTLVNVSENTTDRDRMLWVGKLYGQNQ